MATCIGSYLLLFRLAPTLPVVGSNRLLASACGGLVKYSTCRIRLWGGAEELLPPNESEATMIKRLGLGDSFRLACQFRPRSDIDLRRLVLDETEHIFQQFLVCS